MTDHEISNSSITQYRWDAESGAAASPDELIVFADEDGNPIGTGPKVDSHNADTRLHLAFSVFLFNRRGELLLQQRSLGKTTWPGVWSNSCCGHLMPGENLLDACRRRLRHELGLSGIDLITVLPNFRYRAELNGIVESEICPVLIGFCDQQPRPNPEEVAAVRWISWREFVRTVEDPESGISPWAVEEVRLLAENGRFRSEFADRTRDR